MEGRKKNEGDAWIKVFDQFLEDFETHDIQYELLLSPTLHCF
jgi:hypothetical protein